MEQRRRLGQGLMLATRSLMDPSEDVRSASLEALLTRVFGDVL